ncbi:4a-hydroxytetrahydrobiopterin dehydratase [Streptomyces avicenniae]|uniref:4a-hydroxytetrahydrobiopterin dehydratase n=1 Tax=Streptomyces avicenniae TaxID=500153 RepID=UPI000699E49D|nr:4a-hydroxytetrahydrobiopterin dehydratase [Streptomyces avicenniae]
MPRAYTRLTEAELADALRELPGWRVTSGELTARFTVSRAELPSLYREINRAEDAADHHARITVLHTTLTVAVNTHAANGALTTHDTALAREVTRIAGAHGAAAA